MRGEECQKHEEKNVKGFHRLGLSFRKRFRAQARRGDRHACVVFGRPPAKILSLQTGDQWSPLRSRGTEIVDYTATLFRSIPLKPCRDRRPRRSKKEKILNLQPAIICSRIKSKICCFSGRRGRRPLQARNSNRINKPIRNGNFIVSGQSRTPVPTGNCKHPAPLKGNTSIVNSAQTRRGVL